MHFGPGLARVVPHVTMLDHGGGGEIWIASWGELVVPSSRRHRREWMQIATATSDVGHIPRCSDRWVAVSHGFGWGNREVLDRERDKDGDDGWIDKVGWQGHCPAPLARAGDRLGPRLNPSPAWPWHFEEGRGWPQSASRSAGIWHGEAVPAAHLCSNETCAASSMT